MQLGFWTLVPSMLLALLLLLTNQQPTAAAALVGSNRNVDISRNQLSRPNQEQIVPFCGGLFLLFSPPSKRHRSSNRFARVCNDDEVSSSSSTNSGRVLVLDDDKEQGADGHDERRHPHQSPKQKDWVSMGHNPLLSLNLNLNALVREKAIDRAQELYQRIRALYNDGYYATSPDVVSFNTILKGLQDHPSQALDFWHEQVMEQQQQQATKRNQPQGHSRSSISDDSLSSPLPQPPILEPNTRSFNTILFSFAKAGLYEPALQVLTQMKEFDSFVLPDCITYNTVLLAMAIASNNDEDESSNNGMETVARIPKAPELAEELLVEMMERYERGQELLQLDQPDLVDENLSSSSSVSPSVRDSFKAMREDWTTPTAAVKPDIISFNTVVSAWARSGDAERAELWLFRMKDEEVHVQPDVYSYTTVIQAWARNGNVPRALSLLQDMREDEQPMAPNRHTYTAMMRAYCQNRQPEEAEALLRQLLAEDEDDTRPDVVGFTIVLNGWSKVAREKPIQAVEAVLALLRDMKRWSWQFLAMAPNEYTYTAVLRTLARARQKEGIRLARTVMSDLLLLGADVMDDDDITLPIKAVEPSLIHFNAWLDVAAKAPVGNKAIEAWRIYHEMLLNGIEEDSITLETILAAAANGFGNDANTNRKSLEIGRTAFVRLVRKDCESDDDNATQSQRQEQQEQHERQTQSSSLSFLHMMKVLRKFLYTTDDDSSQQEQQIQEWRTVIALCLAKGCLNDIVLKYIMEYAPAASLPAVLAQYKTTNYTKTKGGRAFSVAQLPSKWSRNATPPQRAAG